MPDEPRIHHKWRPIEDLPENWRELASSELRILGDLWRSKSEELKASPESKAFQQRLSRQWSIETGFIEGIYRIDRGTTNLLMEKGIHSSLIPHGATDKPADEVVEILHDHEQVLEGLFDFVANRQALTTHYIRSIQQALCAHQDYVTSTDSLGNRVRVPLLKGQFKKWRNSPTRKDGAVHEYCPPEHVDAELERLVSLHEAHTADSVPPEIEAAWLHHRFVQIHPFQDGNGRVARCLATLVLLRAGLFPFTVERGSWNSYIDALEAADEGDLSNFVGFMVSGQKPQLLWAVSWLTGLSEDDLEISLLVEKRAARLEEKFAAGVTVEIPHGLQGLASRMQSRLQARLEQVGADVEARIRRISEQFSAHITWDSNPDGPDGHGPSVRKTADELSYCASFRLFRTTNLIIIDEQQRAISFSFHALANASPPVIAVSAFSLTTDGPGWRDARDRITLCKEVFLFDERESEGQLSIRFAKWCEDAIREGLRYWSQT